MAVFKALGKSMSVEEKVTVLVRRHEHNYFVGMSADQLQAFTEEVRPTKPIQEQDVTLSKNERLLIKKLAWVWGSDTEVCQAFKDQVRSGEIKSITILSYGRLTLMMQVGPLMHLAQIPRGVKT